MASRVSVAGLPAGSARVPVAGRAVAGEAVALACGTSRVISSMSVLSGGAALEPNFVPIVAASRFT